jgi:hypothetical protein
MQKGEVETKKGGKNDHPFLLLLSWTITCYSSPFCESCRASYWVSLLALFFGDSLNNYIKQ